MSELVIPPYNLLTKSGNIPSDTSELSFYPIKHKRLFDLYKKLGKLKWLADEIGWSMAKEQWAKASQGTKNYVTPTLLLFSQLDGIVGDNLMENFIKDLNFVKEAKQFFTLQAANELDHNETYSMLLMSYLEATSKKDFDAINSHPEIRQIAEWAYGWMDRSKNLLERLVAFICLEGIIFSSTFAGIYWIKERGELECLTKANEWISRDEGIHMEFGLALYEILVREYGYSSLSTERIHAILQSAVNVTANFTLKALDVSLIGLNYNNMMDYVKTVTNGVCKYIGVEILYPGIKNPFKFMTSISLHNKSNFFETLVTEYSITVNDGLASEGDEDY